MIRIPKLHSFYNIHYKTKIKDIFIMIKGIIIVSYNKAVILQNPVRIYSISY